MRARREALPQGERVRRSDAASSRLAGLEELGRATLVAAYAPTRAELVPRLDGRPLLYPRVTTQAPRLRFHRVIGPAALRIGAFGVGEPDPGTPEVPAEEIDLFVVPGLAFDRAGQRLGYGGGYYDELIRHVRARGGRGLFVGLGFAFQLVERVPAGDGDARLDCVVTDAAVVRP
jgi:5-formyltetrahydrofolate cyclo-ligase